MNDLKQDLERLAKELENEIDKAEVSLDKSIDKVVEEVLEGPWAKFKKFVSRFVAVNFDNFWDLNGGGLTSVTVFSVNGAWEKTDGCGCGYCDDTKRRFFTLDITLVNFRFSLAVGKNVRPF